MSETVYSRAPDVVWRLGPDRVLVRRIGGFDVDGTADLLDAAAIVWVVLDEPATASEVAVRGPHGGFQTGAYLALAELAAAGWITARVPGAG